MKPYSKKDLKKEVVKASIKNPLTLTFSTAMTAGIIGTVLYGLTPMLGMLIKVGAIGAISFFLYYLLIRKHHITRNYLKKLEEEFLEDQKKVLKNIKQEFLRGRMTPEIRPYGKQGLDQFELIQDKFSAMKKILNSKFNPGEITYSRFLAPAEEVYLSVLDNLTQISTILSAIGNVDLKYIDKRIKSINQQESMDSADEMELKTLLERKEIKHKQINEINELITVNETAMTKLDEAMSSIAAVKTKRGKSSQDIEQTLAQLEQLAKSAKKYEIR